MKTLELWDVTGDTPRRTDQSATLTPNGVAFKGDGVRNVMHRYMDQDPETVFNKLDGWSNGYIALKLKGGE